MSEVETAISLTDHLPDIRFPEFTSKLITDTMDAVVSAMIRQMEAYSILLASAAKTIEGFEADEITPEEVDNWLATNFPNPDAPEGAPLEDLTIINSPVPGTGSDFNYVADPENIPLKQLLEAEFAEIPLNRPATEADTSYHDGPLDTTSVDNIRIAVKRKLARTRLSTLQQLVKMGIARIIVDEGKIYTKLTFDVGASQFHEKVKNQYERKRWGAGARTSFIGRLFGISAGASYSKLKVTTVRERDFARVDARVAIVGGVEIMFRTDYSPLGVV